jgi:hypothetical protein
MKDAKQWKVKGFISPDQNSTRKLMMYSGGFEIKLGAGVLKNLSLAGLAKLSQLRYS